MSTTHNRSYRGFDITYTPWDDGDYSVMLYDTQEDYDWGQIVVSLPYNLAVEDAKFVCDEIRDNKDEVEL